ncbi:hypothetical protein Tco_0616989, partial [Tanacetum coccineum]
VSMKDKVENIGENRKEMAMEESACVDKLINGVNEASVIKLKNVVEESDVLDKELNKGVVGSVDSGMKSTDSVELEEEVGKGQS